MKQNEDYLQNESDSYEILRNFIILIELEESLVFFFLIFQDNSAAAVFTIFSLWKC